MTVRYTLHDYALAKVSRLLRRSLTNVTVVALLYVSAIPLFAVFYAVLWREFQQSNASADAVIARVHENAFDLLARANAQWFPENVPGARVTLGNVRLLDEQTQGRSDTAGLPIATGSSSKTPPVVRASQMLVIARGRAEKAWLLSWTLYPALGGEDRVVFDVEGFPPELWQLWKVYRAHAHKPDTQWIWNARFNGQLYTTTKEKPHEEWHFSGEWQFDDATHRSLQQYVGVLQGSPAPQDFGLTRYLYLSVVTITTLGFGDIVPVTDRARMVVALEAIYGVVVAGLFLNALALKINRRSAESAA